MTLIAFAIMIVACSDNSVEKPKQKTKNTIEKSQDKPFNGVVKETKQAGFSPSLLANAEGVVMDKKSIKRLARETPIAKSLPEDRAGLYVTLSCPIGNMPGFDRRVVPMNVNILASDNNYIQMLQKTIHNSPDDVVMQEQIGEDGFIAVNLLGMDSAKFKILALDKRFDPAFVINHEWSRIILQKGKIVHKNYIMSQVWCDRENNRDIRGIMPQSYAIQYSSFDKTYDWARPAQTRPPVLMFYSRTTAKGAFKKVSAPEALNVDAVDIALDATHQPMVINNIQTEGRHKGSCKMPGYEFDLTIKTDAALGVKTITGMLNRKPIDCREAWVVYLPYTYDPEERFQNRQARSKLLRYLDSGTKVRSNCKMKEINKVMAGPATYPDDCMGSNITYTTVFSATKKPVMPWGFPHKFAKRGDLTVWETKKGEVPPTVLP